MKKLSQVLQKIFPYALGAIVAMAFAFFLTATAHAQDSVPPVSLPTWLAPIVQFVLGFVSKYPVFATVVSVVGMLRLALKPIMTLWRVVVQGTPSKADDAFLDRWEQSKAYAILTYVLDWFTSISPSKSE